MDKKSTVAVIVSCIATSILTAYLTISSFESRTKDIIDRLVKESIKENISSRLELHVKDFYERQEDYSKDERFKEFISDDILLLKEGFTYRYNEIKHENLTNYTFSISELDNEVYSNLYISYYGKDKDISSTVDIRDDGLDRRLDRIRIDDLYTGGFVEISRNRQGFFECKNVNKNNAESTYNYFSSIYNNFIKDHDIGKKIKQYRNKVIVGDR